MLEKMRVRNYKTIHTYRLQRLLESMSKRGGMKYVSYLVLVKLKNIKNNTRIRTDIPQNLNLPNRNQTYIDRLDIYIYFQVHMHTYVSVFDVN